MKKIERKKDLQIGHCYRTTQDYFKVDSIVNGEPYGSTYDIYEPTPVVVTHYSLSLYVEEIGCIEISEEEYEETLQRMIINNQDTTQIDDVAKELERLKYHEATTVGLWAIDRDPKEVPYNWIVKTAFQIEATRTFPECKC
ncbi:hypothetical protein [Capnocytophaga felis]|uniref:Uncharacterized protein n=1 Tax=Capnocytophaga felis TaxID=2267611 RepID=A0A5M4BA93_9FLAO|nr:hypothetical protein [Capnocytophaga felis]GET46469.1 hypothetical protein RCZ01_17710 [Capnocytophaga felis]GET48359.1 hypothetical protein RCZ02_11900 [Capnocytophaga felis]